jgi:hypothetical protein
MSNVGFAYTTETALFEDWCRNAIEVGEPVGTLEEFRQFLRTNTLAKEVILDGERCWQFPPLAECRADFERKHGPWKWKNPNAEWNGGGR